jgi:hypothetical protein
MATVGAQIKGHTSFLFLDKGERMKNALLCIAALAAMMLVASAARAQTLLYGMETGTATNPDGFGANGGGVTVSQDTIGATQGTHSLKTSVVAGATFVGALTGNVAAGLTPPLPVQTVNFDYTIAPGDAFAGGFAVVGVTIFGSNAAISQFGLQAQFAGLVHLEGKAAGTYHGSIDLTSASNPLTFVNQSYNQIFSQTPTSSQLTPSGFEFFINKSNDAPLTVYLDNVTLAAVPEPASIGLLATAGGLLLGSRRRRA